jgi:hypothetical protein
MPLYRKSICVHRRRTKLLPRVTPAGSPIKSRLFRIIIFRDLRIGNPPTGPQKTIPAQGFLAIGLVAMLRVQIDDVLGESPAKFQEATELGACEVGHVGEPAETAGIKRTGRRF